MGRHAGPRRARRHAARVRARARRRTDGFARAAAFPLLSVSESHLFLFIQPINFKRHRTIVYLLCLEFIIVVV